MFLRLFQLIFALLISRVLFSEHWSREVSFTGIGKERNNYLALVFGTLCKLCCRPYSRTRGNTDKQALFSCKCSSGFKRIFVFYGDDFIINLRIKRFGYKACTYALNFVRTGCAFLKHGRACGFYCYNLYIGVLAL